ncbi:copper chaperone PCu(A)C [Endozoicomonas sp. ONNA2]|uniref:copper chaperone PCu(A)C n=1 Tax=Endozoicomonas sp. ONNA2 TaxID=2828741 RepID=UPI00214859E6|nr:copper chaperone PCu(A)C [Endozoicomonas sp. ONNA2]
MASGMMLNPGVVRIMRTFANSMMALMVLLTAHTTMAGDSHGHLAGNSAQSVQLLNASARATRPGMSSSAAYMTIRNGTHEAVQIRSLSSPVARKTELHTTEMNNGMMKMRRVDNLTIKPGDTLELKPGGYHVMLMGLDKPIARNSEVPVTITFSNGDQKSVVAHATDEIKGQHMAH